MRTAGSRRCARRSTRSACSGPITRSSEVRSWRLAVGGASNRQLPTANRQLPGAVATLAPIERVHKAPSFDEWEVELHGHRAIYRIAGSGPPLVLVHGMVNS